MPDRDDPFREIEQLFDQFTRMGSLTDQLPVDVVDTGEELVVFVDLPGRDPEEMSITLQDERELHIEADAREDESDGQYLTRERPNQTVSRTVRLPAAVDEAETEANYDRGVLTVRLAKPGSEDDGTEIPVN